jgi:CheY-like chemotaxis protein
MHRQENDRAPWRAHLADIDARRRFDFLLHAARGRKPAVMTTPEPRTILSVEDSDVDFFSLCAALEGLGVANPVVRCADSRVARAMLETDEGCAKAREAAIILLDLNMPGVDGRELLSLFRKRVRDKPIVVLTTSTSPSDIDFCAKAGADDYVVKPLEFDRWQEAIGEVMERWLSGASPPYQAES